MARNFSTDAATLKGPGYYVKCTVFAPSQWQANQAAEYYNSVSRPGMDTGSRMGRAIHLSKAYNAEARHTLQRTSD